MSIESWLLSVIPTILLLALAWLARCQLGSWLVPSAFFALYWGILLALLLVVATEFYLWPGGPWWILFFAWCIHCGTQIGWALAGTSERKAQPAKLRRYRLRWGSWLLVLCAVIGLATLPTLLSSRGYGLGVLLNPVVMAQLAREFSVARYADAYEAPFIVRVLNSFVYLGTIFGGVYLALTPSWQRRLLSVVPFVPLVFQSLVLTSRAPLLLGCIFCIAGFSSANLLTGVRLPILAFGRLIRASLLIAVLFGMFIGLQMLRDQLTVDTLSIAIDKAKVAALGSPSAFSQWLESNWLRAEQPLWGARSLAGVFDLLGIEDRQQGIYLLFSTIGVNQWSTNVYTLFRGLIEDFTLPGAIIVLFLIGSWSGFVYRRVAVGEAVFVPFIALFYAITLWSHVVSILNYNSIVLAWILCITYSIHGGIQVSDTINTSDGATASDAFLPVLSERGGLYEAPR